MTGEGGGGGQRWGLCRVLTCKGEGVGGGMHETEVFKTSGRGYVNMGEVNTFYCCSVSGQFFDTKYGRDINFFTNYL